VLHHQFVSQLTNLEPAAALEHFLSLESSDLKRFLTHRLKVVSSSNSKTDLQNTVRQHLSEEHANKLQGAQQAVAQAEQANAQAHAENVLGKIHSLEVSAALQHFNKLDITSLKTLLIPVVYGTRTHTAVSGRT